MICGICEYDTETPPCTEQLDHTTSDGRDTTLGPLKTTKMYWRSTTASKTSLACYMKLASEGIFGEDDYCLEGYEGPCVM